MENEKLLFLEASAVARAALAKGRYFIVREIYYTAPLPPRPRLIPRRKSRAP
jgi:hypothetical protein